MTTAPVPTLYEWVGGVSRIEALFKAFYERVPADPILVAVINSAGSDNPIDGAAPMPTWGWGEVKGPYTPS